MRREPPLLAIALGLAVVGVASALVTNGSEPRPTAPTAISTDAAVPSYAGPVLGSSARPDQATAEGPQGAPPDDDTGADVAGGLAESPDGGAAACHDAVDSYDPACGPFEWAGGQPPNAPAVVTVSFDPPDPVAGQVVTVTSTGGDPDAIGGGSAFSSMTCRPVDSDGCYGSLPTDTMPCREVYGPWNAPEPPATPFVHSASWTVIWDQPGAHEYSVELSTYGPRPTAWYTTRICSHHSLYDSRAVISGTITVRPAPTVD